MNPLTMGLLGIVGTVSLLSGSYFIGHHKGYQDGYANAVAEVNRANNAALERANQARDERARRCAADPPSCVSDDPWTRDRPN